MYKHFFGFKERPFQLVPDPEYLFLSRGYQEAMAYLEYSIDHGDGFVEITGKVGTGKTTLCRHFLENLDEHTEVAYIFNPRLNALELLQAVNDEFDIPSGAGNTKDLIAALNAFLLKKKAEHKNAVLLIDEAQNLSEEVLEQLRLLSNLETNKNKLLQIILVGQPELRTMLDSYPLRQLGQRITLSWRLSPLNRRETGKYIRHRVNIAAGKAGNRFSESACDAIHQYSGGIPRLINIACDRALLTAYGLNKHTVTWSIARTALRQLRRRGVDKSPGLLERRTVTLGLAFICLVLLAALLFNTIPNYLPTGPPQTMEKKTSANLLAPREASTTPRPAAGAFAEFLTRLGPRPSRNAAIKTTLALWDNRCAETPYLDTMDNDTTFFQLSAKQNNFNVLPIEKDLDLIKRLDLPAIFEFYPPIGLTTRYLSLIKITGNELTFKGGKKDETIRVGLEEMDDYWTGTAYILWKNYLNYSGNIPSEAPREAVIALKLLLRRLGFDQIEVNRSYDPFTREIVKKIQQRHGIRVDGIVGKQTKIVLFNEKKDLKIPHISGESMRPAVNQTAAGSAEQ